MYKNPPAPNGSLYTETNKGLVPTPNGSLYTENTHTPVPLGSFNRAQPTAKGGYMWPPGMSGFRRYNPDGTTTWVPPEVAYSLATYREADIVQPKQKMPDWNGYLVDRSRDYAPPKTIDDPDIRAMAGEYTYHRMKMLQERVRLTVKPSWIAGITEIIEKGPVRYEDLSRETRLVLPYLCQFDMVSFIYTKDDQSGRLLACTGYGMEVYNTYQKQHPPQ